jgi:D-3-phosphoglycerate dehydrogenase
MYKISTLNKIAKAGLSCFDDQYIVTDKIQEADGILVRSQDMHSMELSDELWAIARAGAGVNNIPLEKCAERGIVVFNTPGANANAVKELVIAAMLLYARNLPAALSWTASLTDDISNSVEKGKSQFAGTEISGKTLGIVGLGAIGKKVAVAANALGMKVVGYDPYFKSQLEDMTTYSDLEEMLPLCDYVTIHVPALDSTKGMFNKETLGYMKESAVLLNFSRDKIVNEVDLVAILEEGKLGGYVSDFPNDIVMGKKNVILLPHLGASTAEAEDNCAIMAATQMMDYFENGNIKNSVNFPEVDLGPIESGIRISFITKDVENPVAEMTAALSDLNLNITKAAGATKGKFGYALIEADEKNADPLIFHDTRIIRHRVFKK